MQHLQDRLLDEPIEHCGNPKFSDSTIALGDLLPSHRLRLVAPREQLLAHSLPVLHQVRRKLLHRHPIDSGTAFVLLHSFQRCLRVDPLDHRFHQAVVSWASVSACRRRGFTAPLAMGGFTPCLQRKPQLPGLLVHGSFETHGRFALPSVRPFTETNASDLSRTLGLGRLRLPYYGLC